MKNIGTLIAMLERENSGLPFRFGGFDFNPVDVLKADGKTTFKVNVAGFQKEDLKVELKNGNLVVTGTSEVNEEGSISSKQLNLQIQVGEEIAEDEVNARYENGFLFVSIPDSNQKRGGIKIN